MRFVYFGTGKFGLPALGDLIAGPHRLLAVVTAPNRPAGRGRTIRPGPIAELARRHEIRLLQPDDVNDPDLLAGLRDLRPDLGITAAFGQKLGPDLLDLFSRGCVNIHASLLPKYRGAAPINWAVINRETRTGVTVFQMVQAMDAGPIWAAEDTEIRPAETAGELHDRLAEMAPAVLRAAVQRICAGETPQEQDHRQATLAPKLSKRSGELDFGLPACRLAALICGLSPWPGAVCDFCKAHDSARRRLQLHRAAVARDLPPCAPAASPGTFVSERVIATARGLLEILEVKPVNARLMSMADFAHGYRVRPGDRLLPIGNADG